VPISSSSANRPSDEVVFPQELQHISEGIEYSNRQQLTVAGLPAIRAEFRTSGPTPNWGIEYAIRKGSLLLDIYISQPRPAILAEFEEIVRTLQW
jgi:hypothetical protein